MKTVIILLLLTTTAYSRKIYCPNELSFKDDCNSCKCVGGMFMCTFMACVYPGNTKAESKKMCEPGKKFKLHGEIDCLCNHQGTEAKCSSGNEVFEAKAFSVPKESQYCENRSLFSPGNDCNTCKCSEDGTQAMCTLKDCSTSFKTPAFKKITENKQTCTPGSRFMNYCNHCLCSADGTKAACTRMFCDKKIWNIDGSKKDEDNFEMKNTILKSSEKVCEPGTQFKRYCNTCFCSKKGTKYSCTRMSCHPDIWNEDGSMKTYFKVMVDVVPENSKPKQMCTPRSTFKQYCNNCFCSEDGLFYGCTKMYCDKNIWNEDGTLKDAMEDSKVELEKIPEKKICEPLTTFKEYCNTCKCSADGRFKACTRMRCIEKIFNQDGTLEEEIDA